MSEIGTDITNSAVAIRAGANIDKVARQYPRIIAPEDPRNNLAGLKLNGKRPIQAPAIAVAYNDTSVCPILYMCIANRIDAIAPTPVANPSRPSSQFTVFIIPVIHSKVIVAVNIVPNTGIVFNSIIWPFIGLVKRSIKIVVQIAKIDTVICPIN